MEQPLVSVVIPAYNAGKTLKRMLDSVLGQTWNALEVILVDDGSTDGTAERAREIGGADPRLTVISIKNLGVSAARNTGLEKCTGTYIRFVDADDSLPPDSIAIMVEKAEKNNADLVIGGYDEYLGEMSRFRNIARRDDTVPCDEILDHLNRHSNSYFYGVLWNKLFRRELIEKGKVRFSEDFFWGEDFAFVMDYLREVKDVSFMKESVYDYRRSPNSTTVKQVFDCVVHPARNIRIKRDLYRHLKGMYKHRGQYAKYRKTLWIYLFRAGLE